MRWRELSYNLATPPRLQTTPTYEIDVRYLESQTVTFA